MAMSRGTAPAGRHTTPADTARELRRVRAEQALSHNRMNTVGADDDVGLNLAAVGQSRHSAAIASFDGDATGSKADVSRLEGAAQDVEQIRAVHSQIRRAKLLAERCLDASAR